MATKKQKREAALTKRREMLDRVKRNGLLAQQMDRERRALQEKALKERADEINDRHREILARHGIHE